MPITSDVGIFGRLNFGITVILLWILPIYRIKKKIFCHGWIPLTINLYCLTNHICSFILTLYPSRSAKKWKFSTSKSADCVQMRTNWNLILQVKELFKEMFISNAHTRVQWKLYLGRVYELFMFMFSALIFPRVFKICTICGKVRAWVKIIKNL